MTMTTVASTSVMNGNHESADKEPNSDHSPSRFTAVNGRDVPLSGVNGPSAATPRNNAEPPEKLEQRETADGSRERMGDLATTPTRPEEPPRDLTNGGSYEQEGKGSRMGSLGASINPNQNKRKRSISDDRQATPSTSYPDQPNLPRSPTTRTDENLDPQMHTGNSSGAPAGGTPSHESSRVAHTGYVRIETPTDPRGTPNGAPWPEYDAHLISQAQRAQNLDSSDAQLVEALQRDVQSQEGGQKSWGAVNRPEDSPGNAEQRQYTNYSTSSSADLNPSSTANYAQDRPQAAVQVGPKRKRVFSNRTKTGCMTCRRRKKKCDEQHPSCNNCLRGGFLCEGYSSRSTWQKPSNAKGPVPLQSKEGYPDVGGQYVHEINAQRHDRAPVSTPVEGGKIRPIIVDDADRNASQYLTSPTGVGSGSRGSWSKRSWPGAGGHPAYVPAEHLAKSEYRSEVPPIHELSRTEHPPVVPPFRELSHGPPPKPAMPVYQGVDQRSGHPSHLDTNSPQAQARMALSIEHQLSARPVTNEESEKEKMIRGDLYRPFDIQLVEERERCKAALWRFNNACNPQYGISVREHNRLLKEILVPPPESVTNSPSGQPVNRPVGSIGPGAVVEAPFRCHYGYNVHIGEDVMISENCSIVDDCPVNIGAHTWIGPNVTILGSMAQASMQERKGSQSRYQGRPVTIEEDCWIGAGCIIYPGVRLRRGAYVAPGEIVRTDIVAYGFQGLKPSYM